MSPTSAGKCLQCASVAGGPTFSGTDCGRSTTEACNGRDVGGDAASLDAYCRPCADPLAAGAACLFTRDATCNGHGRPLYSGDCTDCDADHAGRRCEFSRAGTCHGHGSPLADPADGSCACDTGFASASNCEDCLERVEGVGCDVCKTPYLQSSYPACNINACNENHTADQDETTGACTCRPGWAGPRCACFTGLGGNTCLSCADDDPQVTYILQDGTCDAVVKTTTTGTTMTALVSTAITTSTATAPSSSTGGSSSAFVVVVVVVVVMMVIVGLLGLVVKMHRAHNGSFDVPTLVDGMDAAGDEDDAQVGNHTSNIQRSGQLTTQPISSLALTTMLLECGELNDVERGDRYSHTNVDRSLAGTQ